jgi:hypothetical protein
MADFKLKIDCIIIGAQKAGTTSLKNYLAQHPQIATHKHMEFAFFADPEEYELGFEKIFRMYYPDVDLKTKKKIIAKNATLYKKEENIRKLFDHNPNCLIVLILRNPIDRAYSSYQMGINDGWINTDFDVLVDQLIENKLEPESALYRFIFKLGFYDLLIPPIQKYFPKEKFIIVMFEELKTDAVTISKNIFTALGIENNFEPDTQKKYNITKKTKSFVYARFVKKIQNKNNFFKKIFKKVFPFKFFSKIAYFIKQINKSSEVYEPMNSETREKLFKFYFPHNKRLEKIIDKDLTHWI